MNALQTLLAGVVDYAGLFPPAALSMTDAVRRYAAYRAGEHAWMLGTFVVPAARLGELEAAIEALPNAAAGVWPLGVLLDDLGSGLDAVAPYERPGAGASSMRATVAMLEIKVRDRDDLGRAMHALDATEVPLARVFAEVPWGGDLAAMAEVATRAGLGLKLRTGGVVADAFPPPEVVLRFMATCAAHGVRYKLTAGLHHPLRAEQALTYEPGCARGTMHGFLNMLVAAALLRAGHAAARVAPVLEERDAAAFVVDDEGIEIHGMRAAMSALARDERGLGSFGSCSFEEPVADLHALGLLPPAPSTTHLATAYRS